MMEKSGATFPDSYASTEPAPLGMFRLPTLAETHRDRIDRIPYQRKPDDVPWTLNEMV